MLLSFMFRYILFRNKSSDSRCGFIGHFRFIAQLFKEMCFDIFSCTSYSTSDGIVLGFTIAMTHQLYCICIWIYISISKWGIRSNVSLHI